VNTLKYIIIITAIFFALPTHASEIYNLLDAASITAPTNPNWKLHESEENKLIFTHQTSLPPYYTSFLELRISTVTSEINRIEQIMDHSGKRLSRFSIGEANRELLISFNYKREEFLEMDCISNHWETVYPRQKKEGTHTTYRIVKMIECPIPEPSNKVVSLSFAYSGTESKIPLNMQQDASVFFKSLKLHAASKK